MRKKCRAGKFSSDPLPTTARKIPAARLRDKPGRPALECGTSAKRGEEGLMAASTEIVEIKAREILDSRGNPTVEVDVGFAAALSDGPRCLRAHRPAFMKRSSCATAIRNATAAR